MTTRSDPPFKHEAITASASPIALDKLSAIYIGGDGDVTATLGGVSATYVGLKAGSYLTGAFTHVTATTATNLIAVSQ